MTREEINGLNERITDLKMQYQEAERINLKSKAGELLADINYLEELRELRSKQEPKTGHWIGHREHCENLGVMPSGLGAYEWCSNCDCGIDVREWHRNHYNFCPNCGADMREAEE